MAKYLLANLVLGSAILLSACGEEQVEKVEFEEPGEIDELEGMESEEFQEEPVIAEVAETEEVVEEVEPQPVEQVTESIEPGYGTLTQDKASAIISDFLYSAADIHTFSFQNGHISVDVTGLESADEAVNWYMQLSDELLFYEGLQSLTVQFAPYGTVSFSVNQAESSDFGAYFPYEEIEEQLGITYEW